MSPADELDRALAQAEAMVLIIHGAGGETFRSWSGAVQDTYLWAVCDKIAEAKALAMRLTKTSESPGVGV